MLCKKYPCQSRRLAVLLRTTGSLCSLRILIVVCLRCVFVPFLGCRLVALIAYCWSSFLFAAFQNGQKASPFLRHASALVRSPAFVNFPGNTREVPEDSGLLFEAYQCQGPCLFMAFFSFYLFYYQFFFFGRQKRLEVHKSRRERLWELSGRLAWP